MTGSPGTPPGDDDLAHDLAHDLGHDWRNGWGHLSDRTGVGNILKVFGLTARRGSRPQAEIAPDTSLPPTQARCPVPFQAMLQALLRSRLYRVRVAIQLADGQRHEGLVTEIRYDGSRSAVLLATPKGTSTPAALPLRDIVRVEPVSGEPGRRRGAAA